MNTIQKWKLSYTLNIDEINEIIFELYQGAEKKFVYEKNEKINTDLYQLYSAFVGTQNLGIVSFSMNKTNKPFISLTFFEKPTITLKGEKFNVYIYE